MTISFDNIRPVHNYKASVIFVNEGLALTHSQLSLDKELGGVVSEALVEKKFLEDKFASMSSVNVKLSNGLHRVFLIALGKTAELDDGKVNDLGGKIYKVLKMRKVESIQIIVDTHNETNESYPNFASNLAIGLHLASYKFDKYKGEKDKEKGFEGKLTLSCEDYDHVESLYRGYLPVLEGVFLAKDYVSEPPNILYPETYASSIVTKMEDLDVNVEVIGEREMTNLGMGALLGVGQGSINESKLVVMEYFGAEDADSPPVAFVGKGVTFDTGGISIKPAPGMEEMKYDMAGSATVVGAIYALAKRKAKVNAIGVVGLVENMPGGNAQRPGDVVKSMSGQTIEILNTDAEGRLVLADALWYTQDKYKPKAMIDLATLTGAIVVALGSTYAGCFGNNEDLQHKLTKAGQKCGELLWRMPLHKDYDDMIKSSIADVANIGNARGAGSNTAAQFLEKFVNEVPWSHLDIAGVAWKKKPSDICPKGASGFGVRLLNKLVEDYYETN